MSEANIHFKIKEYIMRLTSKKEIIDELSKDLEELNRIKNTLIQNRDTLKEEYNTFEKQNKLIINSYKLSNEANNNINNKNNNQLNRKIGIKRNNTLGLNNKKRNFSAAKPKKRIEINILNDLKKQNNDLENVLIEYNHELNKIIQNVNEMEIKCKLLMHNTDKHTNYIKKLRKCFI